MSVNSSKLSTEEWEQKLGQKIKNLRVRNRIEQAGLAKAANVSLGALKNLEGGKGSSLKTFIKVLRALRSTDVLDALEPEVSISPLQIAQSAARQMPGRVYNKRGRQR